MLKEDFWKQKNFLKFPHGFLWGAATSAHQIEGNNTNSDWWAWEKSPRRHNWLIQCGKNPLDFESGVACNSYNRYEEDFDLAQHLNHNAHRLGIEWARIEPKEGEFSEEALEHYEKVFRAAKAHGFSLFVTLHHFTCPLWFMKKGGFVEKESFDLFVRYAKIVAKRLGQYVDFWVTFNEPDTYISMSYVNGIWPPGENNLMDSYRIAKNIIKIHNFLAHEIKFYSNKPVGISHNFIDLQPTGIVTNWIKKNVYDRFKKFIFLRTVEKSDYIGLNYYFHHHLELYGNRKKSHSHHLASDIGWGIHPEGIERILLDLKKHNKPVYITENGIADAHDEKREGFIKNHLFYVHKAIQQGVDVKGYLYWSLIDNFEWEKGFAPRFGLIEINRESMLERKVRYSATVYAQICRDNCLEIEPKEIHEDHFQSTKYEINRNSKIEKTAT